MKAILILVLMTVGILIGYKIFPEKLYNKNQLFQTLCTAILIFSMGVSLGSRPNLMEELKSLGVKGIIYAVVPIIFSILVVYPLTKKYLEANKNGNNSNN